MTITRLVGATRRRAATCRRRGGTVGTVGTVVLLAAVLSAGAPGLIRLHRGDTLSALALTHHTTVRVLLDLNHLSGNAIIYAGDLLKVPAAGTATRTAVRAPVARSYVVRPNDNLTTVARRLRTTVADLVARNHLRRTTIFIGQRLGYAAAVAPAPVPTAAPAHLGPAGRSAAQHRAVLATRAVPSKAAVRALIVRAARRHGVAPDLALAVAYQESGFQQQVVSPVDAVGVMQVLPSTARSLGQAHGRRFDLLKASDNVEAGVLLLDDLLRATGSWQAAMAGYYQGLGSVHAQGLLPQTYAYIRNVGFLRHRFA